MSHDRDGLERREHPRALELARAHPGVLFATAGVHPHHADELTDELLAEYAQLAREPEVVAIGECGLDYFRDFSPRDVAARRVPSRISNSPSG